MNESEKNEKEYKLPISDVVKAVKNRKRLVAFGAFTFAALLGGFTLIKPVLYEGEASFREKTNSPTGMNTSSLASIILSGVTTGTKSEAKSMMNSKKLLQQLVKVLNLQASLNEQNSEPELLKRIKENISIEYNYFRELKKYPLKDTERDIVLKNIEYPGEFPLSLKLIIDSENSYQLFDEANQKIGTGRIGSPFTTREYSFTLSKITEAPLKQKSYNLTLSPLHDVVKLLSKTIQINPDKEDSTLLKLSYRNRDRLLACNVINQLMFTYQDYLKTEQQRITSEQIHYLNRRENEMGKNLKLMVEDYATQLSSEVSTVGYANSEKAMDFLANQLQQSHEKTLLLNLELQRLIGVLDEESEVQMDAYFRSDSNPKFINNIIEEISALKQQSDVLELALRTSSGENFKKWEMTFQNQVSEIEEIRQCSNDACLIIAQLEKDRFPSSSFKLMGHTGYIANTWSEKLKSIKQKWKQHSSAEERQGKKEEWALFKEHFIAYLTNLKHHLEVREKTIQERLSHEQAPQADFRGINLGISNDLYISYVKQLNDVEAEILQYNFLINELQDPDFEISSLSSISTDPVTKKLVDSASALVLALQDDVNRSTKEKERMKQELEIKRRFLAIHLNQTVDLLNLRVDLIKDKIQSLQNAKLELIHQQISILEQQLSDSIETHISNLKEERKHIAEHQNNLKREMATLPQKWASEMMIEQQLKMNATMVEEVTKLVESKNITANLEMVQSAPVDLAVVSARPIRPNFLLYTILGAIFGAIATSCGVITRNVIRGFPASKESLELANLHVSGNVSKNKAPNIETMRRLAIFLDHNKEMTTGSSLLMANGKGFDSSHEILKLLHLKGMRVLQMDFSSAYHSEKTSSTGVVQYLEGQIDDIPIEKGVQHDKLYLGATYDQAFGKLTSKKFHNLLSQLKEQYDWIIAITKDTPESVEVEALIRIFDYTALNISGETLDQLYQLIQTIKKEGKDSFTTFLITEDS